VARPRAGHRRDRGAVPGLHAAPVSTPRRDARSVLTDNGSECVSDVQGSPGGLGLIRHGSHPAHPPQRRMRTVPRHRPFMDAGAGLHHRRRLTPPTTQAEADARLSTTTFSARSQRLHAGTNPTKSSRHTGGSWQHDHQLRLVCHLDSRPEDPAEVHELRLSPLQAVSPWRPTAGPTSEGPPTRPPARGNHGYRLRWRELARTAWPDKADEEGSRPPLPQRWQEGSCSDPDYAPYTPAAAERSLLAPRDGTSSEL